MKKSGFMINILLVVILLTGCNQQIDIEKRNYVMGLGIDLKADQFVFTFSFPDFTALIGTGESIHYPVVSIEAKSLEEAATIYARQSNRRLDYGQLQSIVMGSSLLNNQEKMEQILNEIKGNREFSRTILACMADRDAYSIIKLDESVNGSIGIYLRDIFDNNLQQLPHENITIGDLIIGLSNPEKEIRIPSAAVDETGLMPTIIGYELVRGISLKLRRQSFGSLALV